MLESAPPEDGMPSFTQLTLAATMMLVSVPAFAKEEPQAPLKREGNWVMDYADGACHLSAAFGSGSEQIIAKFTRVGPEESLRLTLFGKRLGRRASPFSRAKIGFLPSAMEPAWSEVTNGSLKRPDGDLPAAFAGSFRLDNHSWRLGQPDPPPITPEIESAVSGLSVAQRGGASFVLDLETMGRPMAAMRQCTDNLVRHWGFDPQELATRQSRATPKSNPGNWATSSDYPNAMTSEGKSAFVVFKAAIDEKGEVTDCVVLETTNPPAIGPHTCDLIKRRARFIPSQDKNGQPAKDFYINRVFWKAGY
jgi:hypothetical protein